MPAFADAAAISKLRELADLVKQVYLHLPQEVQQCQGLLPAAATSEPTSSRGVMKQWLQLWDQVDELVTILSC